MYETTPTHDSNRLSPTDEVKVIVYADDSTIVYTASLTGCRSVRQAIVRTYDKSALPHDDRYYVYRVTNLTTGTSARYRMDANNNIRLIV